jgi:DNA-binding CsgD family transcriptional regulator
MTLTPCEAAALQLCAEGLTAEQIADRRGCSVHTIHIHMAHVISKLQARNRAHAVALAAKEGLLNFDSVEPEELPVQPRSQRPSCEPELTIDGVDYYRRYHQCKKCSACRDGGRGHGPYWYQRGQDGHWHYVGRALPEGVKEG